MTTEERREWLQRQEDAMPEIGEAVASNDRLPPEHIWLMIDYHMPDGTPVYTDWTDRIVGTPGEPTDVAYVRADEAGRMRQHKGDPVIDELCAEAARLRAENERLLEALEFYADEKNYDGDGAPEGCGRVARAALASTAEIL